MGWIGLGVFFWVCFWLGWVWLAGEREREGGACSCSCVVGGSNNIVRLGRNRIPVIREGLGTGTYDCEIRDGWAGVFFCGIR